MTTGPEGVLVGYDGSERAGIAVDWAAGEARRRGCALTVLSVAHRGFGQGDTPWTPELADAVHGLAREQAAQGAGRARAAAGDLEVIELAQSGGVAHSLIEASRAVGLTVLGNRGHGEVLGAALGSVAFTVSAHAHSPVVVVRGENPRPPGPHGTVVVGVDGSSPSRAAAGFAADVAASTGAPLTIVAAYRSAISQAYSGAALMALAAAPPLPPDTSGDLTFDTIVRTAAEKTAIQASMRAIGRHPALRIVEFVAEGSPVEVLRTASQEAALLVVGSRGRGAFASLTLGSVSHGVIHAAGCPVAVIRESTD